jgi:type I restriction enzyme M protein
MLNTTIKSSIDRLWDKFWSGGISNPLTAIEQISYLLFMKRLDQMDLKKIQDSEFTGEPYKSIFAGKNENLRWSHFRHMEGGEMLNHIQTNVFPFLKTLNSDNSSFSKHMKNAVFIISKPSLVVEAVNIIDEIYEEISRQELSGQGFQDTQGDVYEYLLSEITSAGKLGQFRTPRHIIQLICELVDPKLGDTICDPACGTGGFLLGAYQHILTQHTSKEHQKTDENGLTRGLLGDKLTDERQWKHLKENTFYGYDVDESMVRIGLMNLMMHGISVPNIQQKDTLSKKYDEDNYFDVMMANPPFKGSIDKADINESLSLPTTRTELLFVDRIIKSLKIGGRAGVIVPDGVILGDSSAADKLRKQLIEENQLDAIISLPHFTFKPYASVATYILLFTKGGETDRVWMYNLEQDGYSKGNDRSFIGNSEVPSLLQSWEKRKDNDYVPTQEKHGYVAKEQIVENNYQLSPKYYLSNHKNTKESGQYITLGEIAVIEKGTESAQKIEPGKYPLITTAEEFKTCKDYKYDDEAIMIPLVSSTGHGHASIKRLTYYNGKFSAATILAVLRVTEKDKFFPQFLYYYLSANKDALLVSQMKGAANVSLSVKKIKNVKIPILPLEEQKRLVNRLTKVQYSIDSLKSDIYKLEEEKLEELLRFKDSIE